MTDRFFLFALSLLYISSGRKIRNIPPNLYGLFFSPFGVSIQRHPLTSFPTTKPYRTAMRIVLQRTKLSVLFILFVITGHAQLTITNSTNAQALAQYLVGEGISISNVTLSGSPLASGFFKHLGGTQIGLDSGIVLSSGRVATSGTNEGFDGTQKNEKNGKNNFEARKSDGRRSPVENERFFQTKGADHCLYPHEQELKFTCPTFREKLIATPAALLNANFWKPSAAAP